MIPLQVVDGINEAYCDPQGRPYQDIRIFHTVVLDDPFDDPAGLTFPDASPPITPAAIASDRLGVDDDPMDEDGQSFRLHCGREQKKNTAKIDF